MLLCVLTCIIEKIRALRRDNSTQQSLEGMQHTLSRFKKHSNKAANLLKECCMEENNFHWENKQRHDILLCVMYVCWKQFTSMLILFLVPYCPRKQHTGYGSRVCQRLWSCHGCLQAIDEPRERFLALRVWQRQLKGQRTIWLKTLQSSMSEACSCFCCKAIVLSRIKTLNLFRS